MGVWRDSSQPFVEETGAVSGLQTEYGERKTGGYRRHAIAYSLDAGRLMGVRSLSGATAGVGRGRVETRHAVVGALGIDGESSLDTERRLQSTTACLERKPKPL